MVLLTVQDKITAGLRLRVPVPAEGGAVAAEIWRCVVMGRIAPLFPAEADRHHLGSEP